MQRSKTANQKCLRTALKHTSLLQIKQYKDINDVLKRSQKTFSYIYKVQL